jgi:pimeloyl-ACP methyl ester carboxylesterase
MSMKAPVMLQLPDGRCLAYHRTAPRGEGNARPGVVFLGGYGSDMTGTKAMALEAWAQRAGRGFLRFDYTGHGASSGRFDDGCIGDWARDAADAVARLTEGPQVLVGSSMGGWIALLLARAHPDRLAGLVGVAAAPDFTERLMWPGLSPAERDRLMAEGRVLQPNDYGPEPRVITRRLIEDGRAHLVLDTPLALPCPVALLHGTADADVPVSLGLDLLAHVQAPLARLTLVKDGDHRLSDPASLALLTETVAAIA